MARELFAQLARREVPAPPPNLQRDVHRRLNAMLLTTHLFDFIFRAMPYAAAMQLFVVLRAAAFSLTGRWDDATQTDSTETT